MNAHRNKSDRRRFAQEIRNVLKEVKSTSDFFTEDDMAAAEAAAIECISEERYDDVIERFGYLQDYVDDYIGMDTVAMADIQNDLGALRSVDRDLDRRLNFLSDRIDMIITALSLAGAQPGRSSDTFPHNYCDACGTRFQESHACGTSPTEGWNGPTCEGSSFAESIGFSRSFITTKDTTETV